MTQAKHTPGPWEVREDHHTIGDTLSIHFGTTTGGGYYVGKFQLHPMNGVEADRETVKANARLIAKAWLIPEMVEALEKAFKHLDGTDAFFPVKRAIAKAKGEGQ